MTTEKQRKVVAYLRCSTLPQAMRGAGLQLQFEAIREAAEREGRFALEDVEEVGSGDHELVEFDRLLERAKEGELLEIWMKDGTRAGRETLRRRIAAGERLGITFRFASGLSDEEEVARTEVAAIQERRRMRRSSRAVHKRRSEGKHIGRPPLGLRTAPSGYLVPKPEGHWDRLRVTAALKLLARGAAVEMVAKACDLDKRTVRRLPSRRAYLQIVDDVTLRLASEALSRRPVRHDLALARSFVRCGNNHSLSVQISKAYRYLCCNSCSTRARVVELEQHFAEGLSEHSFEGDELELLDSHIAELASSTGEAAAARAFARDALRDLGAMWLQLPEYARRVLQDALGVVGAVWNGHDLQLIQRQEDCGLSGQDADAPVHERETSCADQLDTARAPHSAKSRRELQTRRARRRRVVAYPRRYVAWRRFVKTPPPRALRNATAYSDL